MSLFCSPFVFRRIVIQSFLYYVSGTLNLFSEFTFWWQSHHVWGFHVFTFSGPAPTPVHVHIHLPENYDRVIRAGARTAICLQPGLLSFVPFLCTSLGIVKGGLTPGGEDEPCSEDLPPR